MVQLSWFLSISTRRKSEPPGEVAVLSGLLHHEVTVMGLGQVL